MLIIRDNRKSRQEPRPRFVKIVNVRVN